jgi:O-antigen ligase
MPAALVILSIGLGIAAILSGRAVAVDRFLGGLANAELDQRLRVAPTILRIIEDFFPFGSGFGTFDPVFRIYEPESNLIPRFLNHAHNDLFELAMTGGLLAILALAIFVLLVFRRSVLAFFPLRNRNPDLFARLGAIMIWILLLASVVDYPLRTPFMATVFVIACGWLFVPCSMRRPKLREGSSVTSTG